MVPAMQASDGGMMAGGSGGALSVAFLRPFHDEPVTGQITIEGYCSWANPDKNPPPRVTLLVNGKPTLTQQASDPIFWLDRSFLREGTNTIQLRATQSSCGTASTPALTVRVVGPMRKRTQAARVSSVHGARRWMGRKQCGNCCLTKTSRKATTWRSSRRTVRRRFGCRMS